MSKKMLKEQIDYFIDHKQEMGSVEREDFLKKLIEKHGEHIPYSKYDPVIYTLKEMINKRIEKRNV